MWQDISTAPRDGSRILVYFGTMGVWQVLWGDPFETGNDGLWCIDDNKHDYYPLRGYSATGERAATHWMPLPAPPLKAE